MSKRKVVISERDNIATLFENDRAVEFIIHRGDILLGDVHLASVENILPSIDAAFVNVGGEKMGFLHSSDVQGKGDLKERLEPKQRLVVQVMKEPTGHKGPRVTTNITLPGRFIVLLPESRGISISRKIEDPEERARLKSVVSLVKPPGVGVIIRTEAMKQKEEDLKEDFEVLLERWQSIVALADSVEPPTLLYRDQDLLYRVIREVVNEDVEELIVDTAFGFQRAQQLVQNWKLDKQLKVTHYTGSQSIMTSFGVDREIRQALQTKVPLPSGGYLYIQPTEALCVVDVNSGKFTSLKSQAETIKITNLEACKEIARQLRLRNIGGMVIVDFIDMESRADQLTVLQAFEKELLPDKAKPQVGQLSDLGLVEMTRHRQGQALSEVFAKKCGGCHGTALTVEEFNWAPPGMDSDARDRWTNRSKLPLRQSRAQQFQIQQAQRQAIKKKQREFAASAVAKENFKERIRQLDNPLVAPGGVLFQKIQEENRKKWLEKLALPDYINEITLKRTCARFAYGAKFSITPPGINQTLSKINAKCNDIWSLLRAMEGPLEEDLTAFQDPNSRPGSFALSYPKSDEDEDDEDEFDPDDDDSDDAEDDDVSDVETEDPDDDDADDGDDDDDDSDDDEEDEDEDARPARRGGRHQRDRRKKDHRLDERKPRHHEASESDDRPARHVHDDMETYDVVEDDDDSDEDTDTEEAARPAYGSSSRLHVDEDDSDDADDDEGDEDRPSNRIRRKSTASIVMPAGNDWPEDHAPLVTAGRQVGYSSRGSEEEDAAGRSRRILRKGAPTAVMDSYEASSEEDDDEGPASFYDAHEAGRSEPLDETSDDLEDEPAPKKPRRGRPKTVKVEDDFPEAASEDTDTDDSLSFQEEDDEESALQEKLTQALRNKLKRQSSTNTEDEDFDVVEDDDTDDEDDNADDDAEDSEDTSEASAKSAPKKAGTGRRKPPGRGGRRPK